MARLSTTHRIDAAPAEVFVAFTDLLHIPDQIPDITDLEVLTSGPIGKGTRFRETRMMNGRECTETMEVTEYEPISSYGVECESCGANFKSTFHFRPDGEGTQVDFDMEVQPLSFFAKLMSPLGKFMMGGVKKCIDKDIMAVKSRLESRRTPSGLVAK